MGQCHRSHGERSCGCHITVGIESVIGTDDHEGGERVHPQTRPHLPLARPQPLRPDGSGRHLNHYSHPLYEETAQKMRKIVTCEEERVKAECAEQCGRGMVNFRKAFKRDNAGRYIGVVEFRVFAGTLNIKKILHHLGSVLGLCRRAHEVRMPRRVHQEQGAASSAPPRRRTACGSSGITSDGPAARAPWPSASSVPCRASSKPSARRRSASASSSTSARFPRRREPVVILKP
jgi:hypothetical protein